MGNKHCKIKIRHHLYFHTVYFLSSYPTNLCIVLVFIVKIINVFHRNHQWSYYQTNLLKRFIPMNVELVDYKVWNTLLKTIDVNEGYYICCCWAMWIFSNSFFKKEVRFRYSPTEIRGGDLQLKGEGSGGRFLVSSRIELISFSIKLMRRNLSSSKGWDPPLDSSFCS